MKGRIPEKTVEEEDAKTNLLFLYFSFNAVSYGCSAHGGVGLLLSLRAL